MLDLLTIKSRPALSPLPAFPRGNRASSTVFYQLLPFVAITRFWGVCFRSQRLRLARLMGEFSELPDQAETGALLLEALRVRRRTDGTGRQTDGAQRLVKRSFRRAARSEIHCRLAEDRCGDRQRGRSRHQIPHRMEEDALHLLPVGSPDAFDRDAAVAVRAALNGQIVRMAQGSANSNGRRHIRSHRQSRCTGHRRI